MHRFVRTITAADRAVLSVADEQYAQLSLAMRAGADPGAVFDTLLERGQIRVHHSDAERVAALADAAVAALANRSPAAVVADTRDQVAALNVAIREQLIAAGMVDDRRAATTRVGERIGVGDQVATRRNNRQLDVANRDLWTVTHLSLDGQIAVTGEHGDRTLPADYVRDHLQLAYASTVHGAQGDTTTLAHMSVSEHTGAASAYVGMTRGREANTAHLLADSIEDAREQWIAWSERTGRPWPKDEFLNNPDVPEIEIEPIASTPQTGMCPESSGGHGRARMSADQLSMFEK